MVLLVFSKLHPRITCVVIMCVGVGFGFGFGCECTNVCDCVNETEVLVESNTNSYVINHIY